MAVLLAVAMTPPAAAAADRRFAIQDFDRIIVEGPFAVRLTTGRTTSAIASGSPRALDGVSVEVQGQTLRVRRNPNGWGGMPGTAADVPIVTLSTRQLRGARLLGSGSIDITGLPGQRADLVLEGSGRIAVTGITTDTLSVGSRGSGTLRLAGRAGTFAADIQGAGGMDGAGLTTQNATLSTASSGDVTLVAQRTARINAAGQGRVTVTGNAACTVTTAGAAAVQCGRDARVAPPPTRP